MEVLSLYKKRALAKTLNIELFLVVSIIWSIIILKLEFRPLRWLMCCLEQDQIEIDCEQSLFCLKINISVCHNAGMRAASCTSTCTTRDPWPRRWYTSLLRVLSLVVKRKRVLTVQMEMVTVKGLKSTTTLIIL